MKYSVSRIIFLTSVMVYALSIMLLLFYGYGCGANVYGTYFSIDGGFSQSDYEFSLHNIINTDWLALFLSAVLMFLLVFPWFQTFMKTDKEGRPCKMLSLKGGFSSVLFTVLNILTLTGFAFLFLRFGTEDDILYGYDRLFNLMFILQLLYMPCAIVVIIRNQRASGTDIYPAGKRKYWLICCVLALTVGVYAFDKWYNWGYSFKEGRSCQLKDGKWGYEDRLHRVVVPHMFDCAWIFNEGLACVGIGEWGDRKYGFIDRQGKIVIPLIYDDAVNFENGRAEVWLGDKKFYIDKKGNRL